MNYIFVLSYIYIIHMNLLQDNSTLNGSSILLMHVGEDENKMSCLAFGRKTFYSVLILRKWEVSFWKSMWNGIPFFLLFIFDILFLKFPIIYKLLISHFNYSRSTPWIEICESKISWRLNVDIRFAISFHWTRYGMILVMWSILPHGRFIYKSRNILKWVLY